MDKYRRSLRFHDGSVDAQVFLPAERLLVTGSNDSFVRLWRLDNWSAEDVKVGPAVISLSLTFVHFLIMLRVAR